ncbi:membrane protein [Staphylococcus aureus]|uniref:Membrane protein n=1 Tax=Staphylococcus aureus TaxID=1280 RepID=A0A2X2M2T2_STAAU|nr:membrane protein [Staphylococcus aureus]
MRKGKLIGMLQMFMTKESIADRIQQELIRLTSHPKARAIVTSLITNEYQLLKINH